MDAIAKYKQLKISAVVRTDDRESSLKIAQAIINGGMKLVEVTVEHPQMYSVIDELVSNTDATIAAGGVITARQAQEAIKVGAKAIVSPIFQQGLVRLCQSQGIPLITTAATPNEAYQAWKAGVKLIKIFPSQQLGGASYIQDLLRPMPFLNVIATGDIKLDELEGYWKAGADAVTVGRDLWVNASEDEISQRASLAVNKAQEFISK